jgi:hypothetical protein
MLVQSILLLLVALAPQGLAVHAAEAGHEFGRIKAKPLREASGVAASRRNPEILWMHNDGEASHVYAVKTTGKVAAQVRITETVEDVEDVAIGPGPDEDVDYLYLGDIGDNDGKRRDVRVVRFEEPSIEGGAAQPRMNGAVVFHLRYPDGPQDAEALMIDSVTGDLVIATKEDGKTRIFAIRGADLKTSGGGAFMLEMLAEVEVEQVSGGDISRDGRQLVLRSEDRGWLWEREPGETFRETLQKAPSEIPVQGKGQGQNGEAIAFDPSGHSYWTVSEGKGERIYRFDLPGSTEPIR